MHFKWYNYGVQRDFSLKVSQAPFHLSNVACPGDSVATSGIDRRAWRLDIFHLAVYVVENFAIAQHNGVQLMSYS
jgi:hypothetical protein